MMRIFYVMAFWGTCLIFLTSCDADKILAPIEYVQWVKNPSNGLLKTKQVKEYQFIAQYKPLDFIIAQEEKKEQLYKNEVEKRKKELGEDNLYYNFRIKNTEGQLSPVGSGAYSEQQYQTRLGYFTFEMQQDIYLLHGKDTLPCTLFQFVRSYDVAPYVDFAVGFKKPSQLKINKNITFVFEDRILGIGTIQMLFDQDIFTNTPTIKTL